MQSHEDKLKRLDEAERTAAQLKANLQEVEKEREKERDREQQRELQVAPVPAAAESSGKADDTNAAAKDEALEVKLLQEKVRR